MDSLLILVLGALGLLPVLVLGVKSLVSLGGSATGNALASYAKEAESVVRQAQQQLLRADEIVRLGREELLYAQASFGSGVTADFEGALDAASRALTQGFALQDSLLGLPAGPQIEVAHQILDLIEQPVADVVAAEKSFVERRDAEFRVDQRCGVAEGTVGELRGRLPAVQEKLRELALVYSPQALRSVQGVSGEVESLLLSVEEAVGRARSLLGSDRVGAVQAVETAERGLCMARGRCDAVFHFEDNVRAAVSRLSASIGSLTSDLADADSLGADGGAFEPLIRAARTAIRNAYEARDGQGDMTVALTRLEQAESDLDAALEPLRQKRRTDSLHRASARRGALEPPGGFSGSGSMSQIDFEDLAQEFLRGVLRSSHYRRR